MLHKFITFCLWGIVLSAGKKEVKMPPSRGLI